MLRLVQPARATCVFTLAIACALSARALAGGLVLPEPNAAALGRAGAATALPDGPSCIYYNPAGLAVGAGLALEAGVGGDIDHTSITTSAGESRTSTSSAAPSLFVSQRLGDHFGMGLGFYRAPSQTLEYPDDFVGRFRVQRASFGGTTLTPAVAGRPFSFISVGFGLTINFGDLDLAQGLGDPRYETRLNYAGTAVGLGGTIGLLAHLYRDYVLFGWSYHSAVDLDHSGSSTTTLPPSATVLSVADARLTLPLPHVFTFALGSRPRPGTAVQAEARLGLLQDLKGFVLEDTAQPPNTTLSLSLNNRYLVQLRAGAEQRLLRDRLALRLGFGYDLGSARRDLDPAFPDGDRVVIAAGLGYHRPDFSLDAGYLAAFSPGHAGSRGYAYPADYSQQRHTIAVTLTVRIAKIGPPPNALTSDGPAR
jgi:long-chain fatty acid transport protein